MGDAADAIGRARHALESLTSDDFRALQLQRELDQGNIQAVATYGLAWATLALAEAAVARREGSPPGEG
jgi:hypothetical protein